MCPQGYANIDIFTYIINLFTNKKNNKLGVNVGKGFLRISSQKAKGNNTVFVCLNPPR